MVNRSVVLFAACAFLSWAQAPSARLDAPIAYDSANRTVWLFGGQGAEGDTNDLWAYSLESQSWRRLAPQGTPPGARHGHTMNYDARGRRLIVFAGQARGFFSDMFAYEIDANRWTRLHAGGSGAPAARYGHSSVYDPAGNRILISHGFTSESGRFDDTWAFDLATNQWRNLNPSGARPLRRCLHHATFDAAKQQMYLYGGCASGFGPCPLGDLWSYDLRANRWTEIRSAGAPPGRERYGIGFDGARNRLVIYGGGTNAGPVADVWEYNLASGTWAETAAPGLAPRWRHESAEARDLGVVFFFGGEANGRLSNELIQYAPPSRVRNAFSNLATPASPGELRTIYGAGFGERPEVRVNQTAATILYASDQQINFQVPESTAGPEVVIEVFVEGALRLTERLEFATASPGVYPNWMLDRLTVTLWVTGVGAQPDPEVRAGSRRLENRAVTQVAPGAWQITAGIEGLEPGDYELRVRVGERESQSGLILQIR